ncbi:hypothetical protein WA026_001683 [Henosepilachna vigintioctopunctata]|uniref:Uncharacterized protein n=1 Tax=Henosepilachna vigintioctopunctata TaxID=420089 RepID=A0AAW1USN8_9CUCU
MFFPLKHKKFLISGAVAAVVIAVIVIVTVILLNSSDSKDRLGAIVTNGEQCSDIGKSIIYRGGNAVDAAIASLFCEGVAMAQSCGLGGGFIMTIFQKESGKIYTLNSREVAPAAATADMYHSDSQLSKTGILAVAVPGELRGYWRAYQRFGGGIPWRELVEPTIKLCREGIHVTKYLAGAFAKNRDKLYADPNLRASYIDPSTNNTYIAGQYIKRPILADTLEIIAKEGGDALHAGSLTDQFVADIKKLNGIITKEDMNNYEPVWEDPIKISLPHGHTLYAPRLPSSGALVAYIMNMLQLKIDVSQPMSLVNVQRLIESFKFAYGMRTRLGDTRTPAMNKFVDELTTMEKANLTIQKMKDNETSQDPEYYGALMSNADNHGTAHISILAPNGDAVSVTSTINYYFGSGVSTEHTDIILNDEMDDFSSPGIISVFNIPPSIDNYIEPGKHPLSSMCPTIILDENNDVKLVIGAAGGTLITTVVADTIVRHLWYNMTIEDSIDACRLHHQLFPMSVQVEECFKDDVEMIDFLTKIGHVIQWNPSDGFSAITAISTQNGISAKFDRRRPGDISYVF